MQEPAEPPPPLLVTPTTKFLTGWSPRAIDRLWSRDVISLCTSLVGARALVAKVRPGAYPEVDESYLVLVGDLFVDFRRDEIFDHGARLLGRGTGIVRIESSSFVNGTTISTGDQWWSGRAGKDFDPAHRNGVPELATLNRDDHDESTLLALSLIAVLRAKGFVR